MAIRGYFESPLHAEPWIESALDVRDRNGDAMPGYGWIFPCGDGTINVGIGLLSTFRGWRDINTRTSCGSGRPPRPRTGASTPTRCSARPPAGACRWPGSIHPKSGPTWIAIGDAAGSINPFNGEGIDYAYETGRMAADLIDEALETGSAMPLARYPDLLEDEYGLYFRVARAFAHVIGQPALMQQLTRVGMQSQSLMEWVLRIMANLLRPDELGPAEAAYRAVATHRRASSPSASPRVRRRLARRSACLGVEGDLAVGGGGPDPAVVVGGRALRRRTSTSPSRVGAEGAGRRRGRR